jgi:hypothetical protein
MVPPSSVHNSVNPFSKKRKFDEVSQSNSTVPAVVDAAKSLNTTVFYDANASQNVS